MSSTYKTYDDYLKTPEFLECVGEARRRSRGHCEHCWNECRTEPHHIRYCKWGEFDIPSNLKMLCRECHENAHRCIYCGKIALKASHIKRGKRHCDRCWPCHHCGGGHAIGNNPCHDAIDRAFDKQ